MNLHEDSRPPQRACRPPPDSGRLQEASPFSLLTLDIVQLRPLLLQLGLQRLRLRLQVGQSLVQLYLLCRHFRELRGSHKFPLCGRRSATKRLKAELTADAAVMTSEGEDAPPVYGWGWGAAPHPAAASCCCCCRPILRYNTAAVLESRCGTHGGTQMLPSWAASDRCGCCRRWWAVTKAKTVIFKIH